MVREETDERDVFLALLAAAEPLAPADGGALVEGALARGRRRLARRRAGIAGATLVVAAAVATGGLVDADTPGGTQTSTAVAGTGPVISAQTAPKRNTEHALSDVVKSLLPPGGHLMSVGDLNLRGEPSGRTSGGIYDDGRGKAGITVELLRAGTPAGREALHSAVTCPVHPPAGITCRARTLPDGSRLLKAQESTTSDVNGATVEQWHASRLLPDGDLVAVTEANITAIPLLPMDPVLPDGAPDPQKKIWQQEKPTRTDPPLNSGQLEAFVTDPVWSRPIH